MTYEWSGLSLEEFNLAEKPNTVWAGLVFVYLTLAAQIRSLCFLHRAAGLPVALLGAVGGLSLRGLENNVYCHIGLGDADWVVEQECNFDRELPSSCVAKGSSN